MSITSRLTTIAAAGSGGAAYWILEYGNSSNGTIDTYVSHAVCDSSGNFITGMTVKGLGLGTDNDGVVSSIAPDGSFNWSRMVTVTGDCRGRSVCVDSSDNVYQVGQLYDSGDGYGHREWIAKWTSSGTNTWKVNTGGPSGSTNNSPTGYAIAVDSSGNVYTTGKQDYSGYADLYIEKRTSAGAISWSRTLYGPTNLSDESWCICVDNAGNLYTGGQKEKALGANPSMGYVRKANASTGVGSWEYAIGYNSTYKDSYVYGNASDGTNVYWTGWLYNGSNVIPFINSMNCSTGAENWCRVWTGTASNTQMRSIYIGSDGFLYAVGYNGSDVIVFKVNKTNGAEEWQLKIDHATASLTYVKGIAYDGTDSFYISGVGNMSGFYNPYAIRLPADGSLTGTFGSWTITNLAATSSTITSYRPNISYSDPTWSPTNVSPALGTLQTPTYTLENLSDL